MDALAFCFSGLVDTPASGGMVLQFSSIIAMLVYVLLAWSNEHIIWVSFYRPHGAVVGVTQTIISEPDRHTQKRQPANSLKSKNRRRHDEQ